MCVPLDEFYTSKENVNKVNLTKSPQNKKQLRKAVKKAKKAEQKKEKYKQKWKLEKRLSDERELRHCAELESAYAKALLKICFSNQAVPLSLMETGGNTDA